MNCWKCFKVFGEGAKKIGFRDQCPFCDADLHVCLNCKYYAPGKPNDCAVPGTEWIKDRDQRHFCEEFAPKGRSEADPKIDAAKAKARKLLGLDD